TGLDVAPAATVGRYDAAIDDELHKAPQSVPGHLGFRAVRIEDAHLHGRDVRCGGEDQPIGASAEMAVAHAAGGVRPVSIQPTRVDDDKVVARAVQLHKVHVR